MKLRIPLLGTLVLLTLSWPGLGPSARAQTALTFSLTASLEQTLSDTTNLYTSKIVKTRITTKEVLTFLAQQLGTNFPKGALIDVDQAGPVHVLGPENFDMDVSQFVSVSLSLTNGFNLFGGTYNKVTQAERSTLLFLATLQVKDNHGAVWVDVSGLATEQYSATAVLNAQQKITATITAPVSGSGSINDELAMISGSITLRAKGTYDANPPQPANP